MNRFSDADRRTDASVAPATKAKRATGSPLQTAIFDLQRSAGNSATTKVVDVLQVQRESDCGCGGSGQCHCEEGEASPEPASYAVVQRDEHDDPGSLAGTAFEKLDAELQRKLKDKGVFAWTQPTLAATLGGLSNATIATMARIGAMISATAPFLWDHVHKIGGGGWITDNFGMGFAWKDNGALAATLAAREDFCKDNPITAWYYHDTTSAFRQIAGKAGGASMHVITEGRTEVHIDVHQPVEGKETSFPWKGQCNYDLSAWIGHAADVGGGGGARGTAVGRYSATKDDISHARSNPYFRAQDEQQLMEAEANLKAIEMVVQKYAALGAMVENQWEGDKQMLSDAATMKRLERAEELARLVTIAQSERRPADQPGP